MGVTLLTPLLLLLSLFYGHSQEFDCSYKSMTNPEKGSYGSCDLTHATKDYTNYGIDTGTNSYGDYYHYEYTLCYGKIVLANFLNTSIDSSTLSLIEQHLNELKVSGTKPIVRIMYATNSGEPDTTLYWVEYHLQQLQPIFEKHSDIIAWFQAGIIGAWGEWHSSTNGLDSTENKVAVYDLLHEYLPKSPCMQVQVRYPMIMSDLVPELVSSDEEAFDDSNCTKAQRLGFHNDCWMSSWHDTGTYEYQGSYNKAARDYWLPYASNVTKYSPYGGETCIDTTTGSIWTEFNCSFIFDEAEILHATFLNPKWHPDVTKYMTDNCCWEEFVDRSGYRFELESAEFYSKSTSVSPMYLNVAKGSSLNYEFTVKNTGWSSLFSKRRGYLSLFQYLSRGNTQTMAIDGDMAEWDEVETGFEDEYNPSTAAVADVRFVQITNDLEFFYIHIRFYNVSEGNEPFNNGFFRIFFDTDNSPSSGYSVGVSGGKIGSELLLEGSNFYDQRDGSWNGGSVSMSMSKSVSADGLSVELKIDKTATYSDNSLVFESGSVTMVVNIADTSWNLVEFSPKTLNGYQYYILNDEDEVLRVNYDIGADLREWRSDRGEISVSGSLILSTAFDSSAKNNENVTVGLWFPDESATLANNTRMNIQLRETISGGEWDGLTGVNMLPYVFNVTEASDTSCFSISVSYT